MIGGASFARHPNAPSRHLHDRPRPWTYSPTCPYSPSSTVNTHARPSVRRPLKAVARVRIPSGLHRRDGRLTCSDAGQAPRPPGADVIGCASTARQEEQ